MPEVPRSRLPRANVLGVGVHALNMQAALQAAEEQIASGAKGLVCVTGVHGVMEAHRDPAFREILNEAFLCVPDGMPTVWVGRLQGHGQMRRVYGPDFMLEMCRRSQVSGWRHFLYGGGAGTADLLARKLTACMPWLKIVGTYTPPFGPLSAEQESEIVDLVARCEPDIFWVGLSTPKQERFMAHYFDLLDAKLMVGVGAAFDLHAGLRSDAPSWMKRCGLQWLYRLCQEPKRLGPRYLKHNPRFVWEICRQFAGL